MMLGASLAVISSLPAQDPGDDMAFELSPFEVGATANIGYRATETLAASRIRTDLSDVGSAVSVVGKEMLRDTGATNNQTLLQYTTGTEVSGPLGNFANLGGERQDDVAQRTRPHGSNRVRGLVSADLTRDFFLTIIPWDSYNTSRVDIQRGPNSALFGVGSPGGIINAGIEGAIFANTGVVEFRTSSHGGFRSSLNVNREIIENELAIRVALLHDKTKYRQKPAYNKDQRGFIAARWEPDFLNNRNVRTVFNANFEKGEIEGNRPRVGTPVDLISPWFLTESRDLHSPTPYNANGDTYLGSIHPMRYKGGYNPFLMGGVSTDLRTSDLIEANPNLQDLGAARGIPGALPLGFPTTERWLNPGSVGTGAAWVDFNSLGFAGIFPNHDSSELAHYLSSSPVSRFRAINATGSPVEGINGFRMPLMSGITAFDDYVSALGNFERNEAFTFAGQGVYRRTTIDDPGMLDFFNHLLDGPNKKEWNEFDAFNISMEQMYFGNRLGFQIAYDNQTYREGREDLLGGAPALTIDVFSHLPIADYDAASDTWTPRPNPNFGRPMLIGQSGGNNESETKFETWRFTPFFELDFARDVFDNENLITQILGRHNFTGLLERHERRFETTSWARWAMTPDTFRMIRNNPTAVARLTGGLDTRNIPTVHYLGDSIASATNPSALNIPTLSARQQLESAQAIYFSTVYNMDTAPAPNTAWPEGETVGLQLHQNGVGPVFRNQANNPANYVGWQHNNQMEVMLASDDKEFLYTDNNKNRELIESWALIDQWRMFNDKVILLGGIRKDKIKSYAHYVPGANDDINDPSTLNFRARPRHPDFDYVLFDAPYPEALQSEFKSKTLKTYSVVVKSPDFINRNMPWDMNFSVFYNFSENFQPSVRNDVFGDPIQPPTGETREYGFTISAFQDRVYLRINRFETEIQNQSEPLGSGFNFVSKAGDEVMRGLQFSHAILYTDTVMNHSDPAIRARARAELPVFTTGNNYTYTVFGADPRDPNTFISAYQPDGEPEDWTEADLRAAHALAVEHARGFIRDLEAMDRSDVFLSNFQLDREFLPTNPDQRQALREIMVGEAEFLYGSYNPFTDYFGGIDRIDPQNYAITSDSLSKGTEVELFLRPTDNWDIFLNVAKVDATRLNISGTIANWIEQRWEMYQGPSGEMRWWNGGASTDTGLMRYSSTDNGAYYEYMLRRAQEGNNVPELRPWRVNIITNYRFSEGALRGVNVGGGYRWQDRNIIGYGVIENAPSAGPDNPAIGVFDVNKPFKGPREDAVDFWIGYRREIMNGIDWSIQFNIRDAFHSSRLIPITTNPDGSAAAYRISEGRRWEVTTRFEF